MPGVIDLDSFITPDWSPDRAPRVFQIDVFLSHNNNDGSDVLAAKLSKRGLVVWHDSNANLVDRRVIQKISKALVSSRLIAVCVWKHYRDSLWVRAEYLPSLLCATREKVCRVVVLKLHEGAISPRELVSCPQFEVYSAGIDEFVDFVRKHNYVELPDSAKAEASILASKPELAPAGSSIEESLDDLISLTHELLGASSAASRSEEYASASYRLYLLRNLLCSEETPVDSGAAVIIRTQALRLATSEDPDVRANGMLLVASLVDRKLVSAEVLLRCIARESSDAVFDLDLHTLSTQWRDVSADRSLIQIAALRAPTKFQSYPQLIAECPEVIRAFVTARVGLDATCLTVESNSSGFPSASRTWWILTAR